MVHAIPVAFPFPLGNKYVFAFQSHTHSGPIGDGMGRVSHLTRTLLSLVFQALQLWVNSPLIYFISENLTIWYFLDILWIFEAAKIKYTTHAYAHSYTQNMSWWWGGKITNKSSSLVKLFYAANSWRDWETYGRDTGLFKY